MGNNPLLERVTRELNKLGLQDVDVVRQSYDEQHFGNAEVVIRVGRLLLRFQRDRGQDLVDLASAISPEHFHQIVDVNVAMGWRSIDDVIGRREPENLTSVMELIHSHLGQLEEAFSGAQERLTRVRVERVAKDRGQAFINKLRR